MNAEGIDTDAQTAEPILRRLIKQHGPKRVQAELAKLMPSFPWAVYQRAQALTKSASKKKK